MKQGPSLVENPVASFEEVDPAKSNMERKLMELQDYVDNAAIGLHWVDNNGMIKWANKAELQMLGYSKEEYIDHHISEFHIHQEKISDILQRLSRHETLHQYESELRCKDGSIKTVQITSNVFWENDIFVHTRCFTVDITEQKKLFKDLTESEKKYKQLAQTLEQSISTKTYDLERKNEELRKSEERYHKMIEEVEDYAIILLDKDGVIQNWNKGAEKIKGYKEKEIVGKSFQNFYLPEDRERGLPLQLLQTAREKGKALHEGWRRKKDGSAFWGSIVLTALHDDQNNIIGFSKVTRDLTERKLTEEKMKAYTNQLEFQNEQLEQFAYAASHDMKEPLRKIIFYNNHLFEKASDSLQEKEKEYLTRSIAAANRMSKLIDDLLEYSKASFDIKDFEIVDLNEVIDEIILSNRDRIEDADAKIHFSDLPQLPGIPFQLSQLFDNLISNAIKYRHEERRPEISIRSETLICTGDAELDEGKLYHKITVADNGVGFETEYSEKIFELFQRLGNTRNLGTGVGLALCKKIVQNHHGTIKATGYLDEGARFEIYLPAWLGTDSQ